MNRQQTMFVYLSLVWKHECRLVRKGWLAARARILFSVIVHSTSSSWMITSFFSTCTHHIVIRTVASPGVKHTGINSK